MTHKRVQYSDHAVQRMRERRFTRQDVRWLLAKGTWEPNPTALGRETRFAKRGYIGTGEAKVVFLEDAERIEVITVEWCG